jgi:hypothetical protein
MGLRDSIGAHSSVQRVDQFRTPATGGEALTGIIREAVDHAASGPYQIDFELRGEGELVELAKSVRNLIAHVRAAV